MCCIIFVGLAILAVILVPIIVKMTKKKWTIYVRSVVECTQIW